MPAHPPLPPFPATTAAADAPVQPTVAVVTGAGRRLGREIAIALARRGHSVLVHHRSSHSAAADLVDELRQTGVTAAAVQADFQHPATAATAVFNAAKDLGEVRVLINSAAVFNDRTLADIDEHHCTEHLAVNLLAPLFLIRQFAEQLHVSSTGHVLNVLDWRALRPRNGWLVYTAAKAALAAATKTLALQLAPRIQVNAIAPGALLPPEDRPDWHAQRASASIPLQRTGTPQDLIRAVSFLLDSSFITGEILHVSGGEELQ
ncbi:MAG: SDR family NAD(P)-dependent oxidoreductase [Planctomycetota bacterium]